MDPITLATLVTTGVSVVRQIMDAIDAGQRGEMSEAEAMALITRLQVLRSENQMKSDSLGNKLKGTAGNGPL